MLYDEATEDWYVQRDPDDVEREERNCMRLAQQFCHIRVQRKTFHICTLSPINTEHSSTPRELPVTRVLYVRAG